MAAERLPVPSHSPISRRLSPVHSPIMTEAAVRWQGLAKKGNELTKQLVLLERFALAS